MKKYPATIGNYLPVLYRCFNEDKYARAFVERGQIRFGLLRYYKEIEDQIRKDSTEGKGSLHIPGNVTKIGLNRNGDVSRVWEVPDHLHFQTTSGNAIYILSCVYPPCNDVLKIPTKFGTYLVRINNPAKFGQEITNWLYAGPEDTRTRSVVECVRVLYNKGHKVNEEMRQDTRWKLSFAQKPGKFAEEHEYRLVVISYRPAPTKEQFLYVDLDGPLTYAELLF
jgi:hypothetical protein